MSAIQLVPYNEAWNERFEEECRKLPELIGDLLDESHHGGSTLLVQLTIGSAPKSKIPWRGSPNTITGTVRESAFAVLCWLIVQS